MTMCAPAIPGVPDEAVEAAAKAITALRPEWNPLPADERAAEAALAAAVPHVREAIAREIEAYRSERFAEYGNEETGPRNYDWALTRAADIARGGSLDDRDRPSYEMALCDPDGIVRGGAMHDGRDYPCTGSAHFMGAFIHCTGAAHRRPSGFTSGASSQTVDTTAGRAVLVPNCTYDGIPYPCATVRALDPGAEPEEQQR